MPLNVRRIFNINCVWHVARSENGMRVQLRWSKRNGVIQMGLYYFNFFLQFLILLCACAVLYESINKTKAHFRRFLFLCVCACAYKQTWTFIDNESIQDFVGYVKINAKPSSYFRFVLFAGRFGLLAAEILYHDSFIRDFHCACIYVNFISFSNTTAWVSMDGLWSHFTRLHNEQYIKPTGKTHSNYYCVRPIEKWPMSDD